jgi:hypothetical protein
LCRALNIGSNNFSGPVQSAFLNTPVGCIYSARFNY